MNLVHSKALLQKLITPAGLTFDGSNPWDPQIHDDRVYAQALTKGSLGVGEAYMRGWWDCAKLDECIHRLMRARIDAKIQFTLPMIMNVLGGYIFNLQKGRHAFDIGPDHYDKGNELYAQMLDSRLVYSCGYWKNATSLEQAQEAKLDLVCKKVGLKGGMRVLDIGCGWGGFAKYAAEKYGVEVVGITVSEEQLKLAKDRCQGLPIDLRLQDYHDVDEQFDAIVSIGMFEHVGHKNYADYMRVVSRCLSDEGLFLLHTIGTSHSETAIDPWINKYIFPRAVLPSVVQISKASEDIFTMEDWHSFGADYDKTLMAWYHNFEKSWPQLKNNYSEHFYRMWKYYLLSCAGSFRARRLHLWQIAFSKKGMVGGYQSIR